jgi:beta-lactamase class C
MRLNARNTAIVALCLCLLPPPYSRAADNEKSGIETTTAQAVRSLMEREGIPGVAVGIVFNGQSYVFSFGLASRATGKPITGSTLFEIGSVSKTFTATLASYAQVSGQLSLADPVSKYLPVLRGSHFDEVSLLNLGTHTPGGLPLQVPKNITNDDQLMRYFQGWKPAYAPGTYRTYANPGIGLLGRVTAESLHEGFVIGSAC